MRTDEGPNATGMAFERRYSDDSGVEYGVRLVTFGSEVEIEHIDIIRIPVEEIGWFIACLQRIEKEHGHD